MKRSKVLEELEYMLYKQRQDLYNGDDYQYAEAILSFLEEKAGMRPPLKEKCPVLFTDKFVWEKE